MCGIKITVLIDSILICLDSNFVLITDLPQQIVARLIGRVSKYSKKG